MHASITVAVDRAAVPSVTVMRAAGFARITAAVSPENAAVFLPRALADAARMLAACGVPVESLSLDPVFVYGADCGPLAGAIEADCRFHWERINRSPALSKYDDAAPALSKYDDTAPALSKYDDAAPALSKRGDAAPALSKRGDAASASKFVRERAAAGGAPPFGDGPRVGRARNYIRSVLGGASDDVVESVRRELAADPSPAPKI